MKFQFSIARLLMATAIVALTFGLARMMFGEKISSYVIFTAFSATILGLLVIIAQKRSDIYRVIHAFVFITFCVLGFSTLVILLDPVFRAFFSIGLVALLISDVLLILLILLLNKLIAKAEAKENERDRQQGNDSTKLKEP
jgi:hypothetical protein